MPAKTRVLLVDDHQIVREGYRRLFEVTPDIEVVAEADNAESALDEYRRHKPEVTVMDLAMPGMGGLEACRRLIARYPKIAILVFSVHESEEYVNRTLQTGVKGYVSKRSGSQQIIAAVRSVARGQLYVSPELVEKLLPGRGGDDALKSLTPREFEVFRLIAEGHSVRECAETLNLSAKTVGHHYTSLRQKLNVDTSAQLIRLAIRNGIIEP